MIEFGIGKNGSLNVVQRDISPSVYLDHWALRKFSENSTLAGRLTEILHSRKGTFVLSWLNLVEFTKVMNEGQARKAESLIEANLPQVFFLETEPFVVIHREDSLVAGGSLVPPHADAELLRAFVELKPDSVRPFTPRDLFRSLNDSALAQHFNRLADTVVERVEVLRNELDHDVDFSSAVRRLPAGRQIQRGTRFILRELVRGLLIDKQLRITKNHAIDLLHAVVPVAYCDLVLLDKHWVTLVDRARSRIEKAGLSFPVATVFSEKANGVDRFLQTLESPTPSPGMQRPANRAAPDAGR